MVKAGSPKKEVKRFGGGKKAAKPITFELVALRDDEEVVLNFGVRISAMPADAFTLMEADRKNDDSAAVATGLRIMTKVMDNKDGVSAYWEPTEINPEDKDLPEDKPKEPSYRGPDGEIYAFSDKAKLAEFQAVENGSSKRRWKHLLNDDDDLIVDMEDINEMLEWMISEASARPTSPQG